MFRYASEAAFSRALCAEMKKHHWFVQRVETAMTGRGVPDIFCISSQNTPMWIELKRIKHNAGVVEQIPWRPGQQAWLHSAAKRGMKVYTLCCFNDVIWGIKHDTIHEDNRVSVSQALLFNNLKEVVI